MARTRLALLVAVLAPVSGAQDQAYQRVRSADGKCSVEVPASWTVKLLPQQPDALLQFDVSVDGKDTIACNVWHLKGQRDIRAQLARERDVRAEKDDARISAETQPIPHLVLHFDDRVEVIAYAMVRRNGVNTQLVCAPEAWPALRDVFFHMAGSMQADLDEWPSHPARLRRESRNAFIYLVDPDVKNKDLATLQSLVVDVARDYEKTHGKLLLSSDSPPIIIVHNTLSEAKRIWPELNSTRVADYDSLGARIFLSRIPPGRCAERADTAMVVQRLVHIQHYGSLDPYWMCVGESRLRWSEERTGLAAPRLAEGQFNDLPSTPVTLERLVAMEETQSGEDAFHDNSLAYALFFTAGPEKYRKAYEAFKATLAATHDATTAQAQLLALDQSEMQAELAKWLRRSVRPVETK